MRRKPRSREKHGGAADKAAGPPARRLGAKCKPRDELQGAGSPDSRRAYLNDATKERETGTSISPRSR
jgi:hypothetical protein